MSKTPEMYQCKSYVDDNGIVQDCECGQCGYLHNVRRWKEAYEEVLKVCSRDKYRDFKNRYESSFGDIYDMETSARGHLMLIEWFEKYGLKISHEFNPAKYNCLNIGTYTLFNRFNDAKADKANGSGKFISWSDDGRQPNNEWLFVISFPTGAYIFGQDYDYQQALFQEFITELKNYKPDYSDTVNKTFYWKLPNTKPIYDEFNSILRRYQEKNKAELKQREADKLRKKLEKLESES